VLGILDEFYESFSGQFICEPLHPLATGRPHLGDLRHSQRTKASHEAERTTSPAGDQPSLLPERTYSEEALGHFEHQLSDRLVPAVEYLSSIAELPPLSSAFISSKRSSTMNRSIS
jgi:hypothetical protein